MTLFNKINIKNSILRIFIILITALLIFLLCHKYVNANIFKYNDVLITNKEYKNLIKNRIEKEILITSIKFNDNELFYDSESKTYFYSLVEGSSTSHNPHIKLIASDYNIAIVNGKITDKNIENNNTATLLIYNDDSFEKYNLKFTTLPLLNINYNEDNDVENNTNMNLTLFDNSKSTKKRLIKSDGEFKIRGGTTRAYPKKSFKISLKTTSLGNNKRNNNISLLGLRKDDDYILYAGYNDQEKIRNVFASNLWYESCGTHNMFGIKNGNYYKYVELFINNKYRGLYAIANPIDDKQLNIKKGEYIYKKVDWQQSESDANKTGNIKFWGYEIKNKDYTESNNYAEYNSLNNYYYMLEETSDIDKLYGLTDTDNMIDYYLFTIVIQGVDNPNEDKLKNVYITSKIKNNNYVMLYTPWDMDMSFGNLWAQNAFNFTIPYGNDVKTNNIFTLNPIGKLQQINDKNINNLVKERYTALREDSWSDDSILEMISNYENDIYNSGAYKREKETWPNGSYYEDNIKLSEFKQYVLGRLYYTDKYINDLD